MDDCNNDSLAGTAPDQAASPAPSGPDPNQAPKAPSTPAPSPAPQAQQQPQAPPSPFPKPQPQAAAVLAQVMSPGPSVPPLPPVPPPPDPKAQARAIMARYTTSTNGDYIRNGEMTHDIRRFHKYAGRRTGYRQLDKVQPFYPGTYCFGAISSLGKTTFATQLADQVAAAGTHVLYFSLEQTKFELVSKSIARGFFRTDLANCRATGLNSSFPGTPSGQPIPASIGIRRGSVGDGSTGGPLRNEFDAYAHAAGDMITVIDGIFSLTVEDIAAITKAYVTLTGITPLVVVDYLQAIRPTLVNGRIPDSKTATDHNVQTLKLLQNELDLTLLAISSLNRQNYLTPIDFESFKESGNIEYTFDVVWGLQLMLLNEERFYFNIKEDGSLGGQTSLKQKREMVNKAKSATPREVQFVCLKNRFGISNYTADFLYYPASDFFEEPVDPNRPETFVVPLGDPPFPPLRAVLADEDIDAIQAAAARENAARDGTGQAPDAVPAPDPSSEGPAPASPDPESNKDEDQT